MDLAIIKRRKDVMKREFFSNSKNCQGMKFYITGGAGLVLCI